MALKKSGAQFPSSQNASGGDQVSNLTRVLLDGVGEDSEGNTRVPRDFSR